MRPVFTSPWLSLLHWFYPPYTGRQERMIDMTIKLKP
jgi:hypothetical protein